MKIPIEFEPLDQLPEGWRWRSLQSLTIDPLQDVVDGPFGSNLKAAEYVDEGVPIARLQNVDRNEFIHKNIRFIPQQKANELARHEFRGGDILVTKLGDPVGKACIVPPNVGSGVIVADVVRVRPDERQVDHKYLAYAINSPAVIRQLKSHIKGTTRPRVNLGVIRELPIPVAPRDQQTDVVAEIEKQFSRLDEAVANLKRVKANLKRYKAVLLRAAVEGRLVETEADFARREGRNHETGAQLLQRILDARRNQWKGKGKYKELMTPDTTNLPQLPESWTWATIEQLTSLVATGATPYRGNSAYWNGGIIPWVTSGALNDRAINSAEKFITPLAIEETNAKLFPAGTLLVALYGEGKTRGMVSELRIRAATNQACAALLFDETNEVLRPFLRIFLEKNYEDVRRLSSGGVQPNLSLSIVKQTKIPLPPLAEQRRIIAEVDRRLSLVREVDAQVNASFKRAQALRQTALAASFGNRLVSD